MLTIRPEIMDDYKWIREVNNLAFKQDNEGNLVDVIRTTENFIPELSLVAEEDGKVVGHILFSTIHIETDNGLVPVLGLAPIAVKPEFQNKGIGSKLVKAGLKVCTNLGHKVVIVLGHPNFYIKFGFIPARPKGIVAPFSVPDEAFMVCELTQGALEGVRGIIKYPVPFDEV